MASICSFMPKNLLRVLISSGPQRVGSTIIRCSTTKSARDNKPPPPPIKTKDPQTHADPTGSNKKNQKGGEAMSMSSSTREDKSSNRASS